LAAFSIDRFENSNAAAPATGDHKAAQAWM
jgi:hypothetical protein